MEFLFNLALFSTKALIIVIAILLVLMGFFALLSKGKALKKGKLQVKHLNEGYRETKAILEETILDKTERKRDKKAQKEEAQKTKKAKKVKKSEAQPKKRVFVLEFDGDMKASQAENLRKEVSALLSIARPEDEAVIRLTSPGGMVHGYGFAAAQLDRIKQKNIPLTIAIDKVAASGGYMMACVADKIIAAPFAIIGSIGAVIQLPNFNKWLKKHDIEFEQLTAGEFKRTLTMFGENTEKGREKMQTELETAHALFKRFIADHRPQVDLATVATGEHWFGTQALELKLVDQLLTSDDYLDNLLSEAELYQINYQLKKSGLLNKLNSKSQALYQFLTKI